MIPTGLLFPPDALMGVQAIDPFVKGIDSVFRSMTFQREGKRGLGAM